MSAFGKFLLFGVFLLFIDLWNLICTMEFFNCFMSLMILYFIDACYCLFYVLNLIILVHAKDVIFVFFFEQIIDFCNFDFYFWGFLVECVLGVDFNYFLCALWRYDKGFYVFSYETQIGSLDTHTSNNLRKWNDWSNHMCWCRTLTRVKHQTHLLYEVLVLHRFLVANVSSL